VRNAKQLAKYLWNEISNLSWRTRAELMFNKLTPEAIEFWISQHKIQEGHSEWSEELIHIWIED
jgi:hypothetical protein